MLITRNVLMSIQMSLKSSGNVRANHNNNIRAVESTRGILYDLLKVYTVILMLIHQLDQSLKLKYEHLSIKLQNFKFL